MPSSQSYTSNGSKTASSSPFALNGVKYDTTVESQVTNGNISASSISLRKEVTTRSGKDYQEYAKSYDGGKTWYDPSSGGKGGLIPLKPGSGLSAAEIKSLKPGGQLNKLTVNAANGAAKKSGATPLQQQQLSAGNATALKDENASKPIDGLKPKDIFDGTNKGLPGAGEQYRYPKSMNARQDCIVFNMLEYSSRALTDTSATTGDNPLQLGKRSDIRTSLGSVRLPIQGGIVDGNAVVWGEDKMNALELFQINVAKQTIAGGFAEGLKTTEDGVKQDIPKSSMANLFASAVTGKNALGRAEGAIVNENMELLFQSVTLRTFIFNFKMSARDPGEAKEIVNIIRFFKQGMAAKRTKNEYFLKSPNTFKIDYLHDGKDHPGINKIKECALQTCNVNYTPDGFYSAHYDGYLVTYDVSMQFQELEPVYNDEYSGITDSVGY